MTKLPGGNWLTLTEAAALIGLSVARLSVLASEGRIATKRIGRSVLIEEKEARRFKKAQRPSGRPKKSD